MTTYAEARPTFVNNYMNESTARKHAAQINGRVFYVWASGIDTWEVHANLQLSAWLFECADPIDGLDTWEAEGGSVA